VWNGFKRLCSGGAAGGMLLALATLLALWLANSPWRDFYQAFNNITGVVQIGGSEGLVLSKSLLVWVNDLWMAVFFFLVGLEIKREMKFGALAHRAQMLLPAVAALGGMIVPALIYALFNLENPPGLKGWAIPAATDIAFALGIVSLLGARVPGSLKVFLTAVAIIDDLGAIVVIALFYSHGLSWTMLAAASGCLLVLAVLNAAGVRRVDPYVVVGLLMWVCVLKSGVHATLAGVATALLIPQAGPDGAGESAPGRLSSAGDLEHGLHPWVAFLVLPMFAFANAGVALDGVGWSDFFHPVSLGIALGLCLGKPVGVFGCVWVMIRLGRAQVPAGADLRQIFGVCVLCGIGFTMSLFIGGLAFDGSTDEVTRVKLGVLIGSVLSGIAGAFLLWFQPRKVVL
jgi:Na+:H+ antiporter, NhaA family